MKFQIEAVLCLLALFAANVWGQDSALTCSDFRPTPEALQRFPDLKGACESVVERDGELYGKFRAVVRRASFSSVTLYLPATDHTFVLKPRTDARVLLDGKKVRPRDLERGQEVKIYLAAQAFSKPDVEEVALVTESEIIVEYPALAVASLPTTASPWPAVELANVLLLGIGWLMRRYRLQIGGIV